MESLSLEDKKPYKTVREYYNDSYQYFANAKVIDSWKTDKENEMAVVLDRTIFHPQGGGQPADDGTIVSIDESITFTVKALQAQDNAILHLGSFTKEGDHFEKGQDIAMKVDGEKRKLYARYHSAGHLLDIAVRRCGQTQLHPGKGYHFPVGAYVEYIGVIDNKIKDQLMLDITAAANAIIKEKLALSSSESQVWSQVVPYEEAGKIFKDGVPSYIPMGQDLRVVKLTPEDEGCPCGGTHVKSVTDIEYIEITKIVKKGKNTRVSYIIKDSPPTQ